MPRDCYKTQKFLITFYRVDYADIDPNISHKKESLIADGYTVSELPVPWHSVDEACQSFGIPVEVEVRDYDCDKIKKDYGFSHYPQFVGSSQDMLTFADDTHYVSIKKSDCQEYLIDVHQEALVYRKQELYKAKSKAYELYSFLCFIFNKERRFTPLFGNTYALSPTMIDKLEEYDRKLGLSLIFNKEQPNVFFIISDV